MTRIADRQTLIGSHRTSPPPQQQPGETTLTPASHAGRGHALQSAVVNPAGTWTKGAGKAGHGPSANPGVTVGLARSLVNEHGAGIASASMPSAGRSQALKNRHGQDWAAGTQRMTQELRGKHVGGLVRFAASYAGFKALTEVASQHGGPTVTGADYRSVAELGKQFAVAQIAQDLRAAEHPEALPNAPYPRLVAGEEQALRVRDALVDNGLPPLQVQARMMDAADQVASHGAVDLARLLPARRASAQETPPDEIAHAELVPGAALSQVHEGHAVLGASPGHRPTDLVD